MNITLNSCCCGLFALLLAFGSPQLYAAAQNENDEVIAIIKNSSDFLKKQQRYSVSAETGYEVVQENGQKIEFGSVREATVQRPNHVRMNFKRRDGISGGVVLDGKEIVFFNTSDNVYSRVSKPGSINSQMEFLSDELQIPVPMQDFLAPDFAAKLTGKDTTVNYINSSTVNGVACDHIAIRTDDVDVQIWIAEGKQPLPQRIVITYKHEPGQPQFRAQIREWNLSPKIPAKHFRFTPPKGAEQIPIIAVRLSQKATGGAK